MSNRSRQRNADRKHAAIAVLGACFAVIVLAMVGSVLVASARGPAAAESPMQKAELAPLAKPPCVTNQWGGISAATNCPW